MKIFFYITIIIITALACLDLLIFVAAGASSHNVPVETFRTIIVIFIGLVSIDYFVIYQLKKIKRKMNNQETD